MNDVISNMNESLELLGLFKKSIIGEWSNTLLSPPYSIWIVLDMGNPWVFLTLSLPVSVCTRTHVSWVRVLTGFPLGTDKGMQSAGMGMGLLLHNTYYYDTSIVFILNKNLK